MMFDFQHSGIAKRVAGLATLATILVASAAAVSAESFGTAVVPTQTIYPGQEIEPNILKTVEVTNPNLAEGYARSVTEVQGMVSTRTLLPGRTIMVNALREPYTVRRGDKVTLVYDNGILKITASGTPLSDAVIGDLIKARNTDTGVIVSGTVTSDGTIMVVQK